MIKKLIFMAALLAPCLAYGQNPSSANLSVQVVSSGNGIPCVYGPNFTGAIPEPAQKAGYTTCYANYDFSTAFMGNLSNWLDCAGASSPLFFNTGYLNGATPCARYSIVSDTVNGNTQNILDIVYTLADAQARHSGTWMNTVCGQGVTCNTGAGSGVWPIFGWFDMTMKVTPANLNVFAAWYNNNPTAYHEDMD
jgi:hypothetical protein